MTRREQPAISIRYDISAILVFNHSYHVGSGKAGARTDKALSADTGGAVRIPATAFCGALRAHLHRAYPQMDTVIDGYFGTTEDHSISSVWIADLYPVQENLRTTVRDGVAIRRDFLTARKGLKYDYEIGPYGASFGMNMRIHIRKGDEENAKKLRRLVKSALLDLRAGKIRVGGQITRGLGRCRLENLRIQAYRFPRDLKSLLTRNPSSVPAASSPTALNTEKPLESEIDLTKIRISCRIHGNPLLVKDGLRSKVGQVIDVKLKSNAIQYIETDHYFVKVPVAGSPDHEIAVIPGGSIKGAIRSRAEKILRTLEIPACDPTAAHGKLKSCAAGLKDDDRLKKLSEKTTAEALEERCRHIESKSCRTCRLFGSAYLAGRMAFADSPIEPGVDKDTKRFDSVAINRFTSGPKQGALFNFKPYINGGFTIRMEAQDLTDSDRALLLFVIRDLQGEEMPISLGFGKTKGFGMVKVTKVEIDDPAYGAANETYETYLESHKETIFQSWSTADE